MPKKLTSIFIVLALACGIFGIVNEGVFLGAFDALNAFCVGVARAHSAEIAVSGGNAYKAVRLTPEVYNAANAGLSDLLVKDGDGANAPYFVNNFTIVATTSKETYNLRLADSYLKDDSFYFDYELATEYDRDIVSTSLEFSSGSTDFAKAIDVYGSYDGIHWDFLQSDKLYSIDGATKLAITFGKPQKFTRYRLRLANNLEKINFTGARLVYNTETAGESYFIESFSPAFTTESGEKRTEIKIEGLKNLRLCDAEIHTDSMFKRVANAPGGASKELYNLTLNGTSYSDTAIPLHRSPTPDDVFVITISDGDDKPINVSGVTVRYYADDIVFDGGGGGPYTLEFSGDAAISAPVYDIEKYKNEILAGDVDRVELGAVQYATVEETPPPRDYKFIYNIVIVAVALLLAFVIIFKLKK